MHPTGPSGGYSIAGSMSFEIAVHGERRDGQREPARAGRTTSTSRTPFRKRPSRPPASPPSTAASAAASSTSSPSRAATSFSGSFRDTLNNDNWRTLTPFEETAIAADPAHKELRVDKVVPTYEYTFGGPVSRTGSGSSPPAACRPRQRAASLVVTEHPLHLRATRRSATRARAPIRSTRTTASRATTLKIQRRAGEQHVQHRARRWICAASATAQTPQDLSRRQLQRRPDAAASSSKARYSRRHFSFIGAGAHVDRSHRRHAADRSEPRRPPLLVADTSAASATPRSATTRTSSSRAPTSCRPKGAGSHNMIVRLRQLQRQAVRQQPPVRQRLPHLRHRHDHPRHGTARSIYPQFLGDGIRRSSSGTRSRSAAQGIELPHPLGCSATTAGGSTAG